MQIPYGNDNQKSKGKSEGKGKGKSKSFNAMGAMWERQGTQWKARTKALNAEGAEESRFPTGMTTRKAKARAKAKALNAYTVGDAYLS